METIIKEEGIKAIQSNTADAIKKRVTDLSLEANENLISALYAESLMPSLDEQIGVYSKLIEEIEAQVAAIVASAEDLKGQEAYNLRKTTKPLEDKAKAYTRGRQQLIERKATTLERINNFRMDSQLNMHKIAHSLSLGETTVSDSLVAHIESLKDRFDNPVVEETTEEEVVDDVEISDQDIIDVDVTNDEDVINTEEKATE